VGHLGFGEGPIVQRDTSDGAAPWALRRRLVADQELVPRIPGAEVAGGRRTTERRRPSTYAQSTLKSYVTTKWRHAPGSNTSGTSNSGMPLLPLSDVRNRMTSAEPSCASMKLREAVSAEYETIRAGPTWSVAWLAARTSTVKPEPEVRSACSRAAEP
jgi:hypothetical protein